MSSIPGFGNVEATEPHCKPKSIRCCLVDLNPSIAIDPITRITRSCDYSRVNRLAATLPQLLTYTGSTNCRCFNETSQIMLWRLQPLQGLGPEAGLCG